MYRCFSLAEHAVSARRKFQNGETAAVAIDTPNQHILVWPAYILTRIIVSIKSKQEYSESTYLRQGNPVPTIMIKRKQICLWNWWNLRSRPTMLYWRTYDLNIENHYKNAGDSITSLAKVYSIHTVPTSARKACCRGITCTWSYVAISIRTEVMAENLFFMTFSVTVTLTFDLSGPKFNGFLLPLRSLYGENLVKIRRIVLT